jgi:hypothetical protein
MGRAIREAAHASDSFWRRTPTTWVEWDVCSSAANLMPETVTVYVDDCAVSQSRVGPAGALTE